MSTPALFPSFYTNLLAGNITLAMTWKACLLSSAYTYDPTDTVIGDVTGILATTTITGLALHSTDKGLILADDIVWTSPPSPVTVKGTLVYVDSTTDMLVAYYGRRADGRAVDVVTDGTDFTQKLSAGRLLRVGGDPAWP